MMSIKERFNLLREVSSAFSFLYTRDKLLLVQQENVKEFQKKFGDIDSDEMSAELQRFVLILQKKRNLNTAQDFLNYLLKTHLFELYPNVYIALRILLTSLNEISMLIPCCGTYKRPTCLFAKCCNSATDQNK